MFFLPFTKHPISSHIIFEIRCPYSEWNISARKGANHAQKWTWISWMVPLQNTKPSMPNIQHHLYKIEVHPICPHQNKTRKYKKMPLQNHCLANYRVFQNAFLLFFTTLNPVDKIGIWTGDPALAREVSAPHYFVEKMITGITTLPSTTLHYITLHYTPLQLPLRIHNYSPLHSTTLNYTTPHYITLHYTTFHYTPTHYTTLHYTTLQYTPQIDR